MRSNVPSYELQTPTDLAGALELLAQNLEPATEGWRPFAGGTDLMVLLEAGKLEHKRFVSIWGLPQLRGITASDHRVTLGALTTYTEIQEHDVVRRKFPMLCQAARETGGVAIQNRGTIGGNIVNASPAADSGPALLAYDAEVELVSKRGSRTVPYSNFHLGYKEMDLRPDELLRAVHIPMNQEKWTHYYRKVGARKAQAISKVSFAQRTRVEAGRVAEIRIALGSVAPTVIRCKYTEVFLTGRRLDPGTVEGARKVLATEISPIDDIRSTAKYRRQVSLNLLEDALLQAALSSEPGKTESGKTGPHKR